MFHTSTLPRSYPSIFLFSIWAVSGIDVSIAALVWKGKAFGQLPWPLVAQGELIESNVAIRTDTMETCARVISTHLNFQAALTTALLLSWLSFTGQDLAILALPFSDIESKIYSHHFSQTFIVFLATLIVLQHTHTYTQDDGDVTPYFEILSCKNYRLEINYKNFRIGIYISITLYIYIYIQTKLVPTKIIPPIYFNRY